MSNQFEGCESTFQNTEFPWSHSGNWLLLNSYIELKEEFRDPKIKKRELWNRISEKFRDVGYEVPFEMLDKKFRNLKTTYYQVKEKNLPSNKKIKWEYYKVFDELLKDDANNSSAPVNTSSMDDPRLETRKRKRAKSPNKNKKSAEGNIQNETIGEDVGKTRKDNTMGLEDSERIDECQNDTFGYDDDGFDDESTVINNQSMSPDKKVNLRNLEARKLFAETRYFNKKADYFEKQTMCVEMQRKLMIMQAHKLKLEIELMRSDQNTSQ